MWSKIKAGEKADFNEGDKYGGKLNPRKPGAWPKTRILSPQFLKTILVKKQCNKLITYRGVHVVGAWFTKPLDMTFTKIFHLLALNLSKFENKVDLTHMQASSLISFQGSKFDNKLLMSSLNAEKNVFLRGGVFEEVVLENAKIKGPLELNGSIFNGTLRMNGLDVGSNLFMSGSDFIKEVDLTSARIEGKIELDGSQFQEAFNMIDLVVDKGIFMKKYEYKEKEKSKFIKTVFRKEVNLQRARMGNLFIKDSEFFKPVDLSFSKVYGNFFILGGMLSSINLLGAQIDGEFWLYKSRSLPKWSEGAKLILSNTRVGLLQDHEDAWPENLELDGFSYNRWGSSKKLGNDIASRDLSWSINWLAKTGEYSPQPYQQLGGFLRKEGFLIKGNKVLFESYSQMWCMESWSGVVQLNFCN
ncbi:MAG: hypothetical protein ACE5EK_07470 [Nitrospinales bacterium]